MVRGRRGPLSTNVTSGGFSGVRGLYAFLRRFIVLIWVSEDCIRMQRKGVSVDLPLHFPSCSLLPIALRRIQVQQVPNAPKHFPVLS